MKIRPSSPGVAAEKLISMCRYGPTAIFVGAFVSSRRPSGLPMALPLKQEFANCMWEAGGQRLANILGTEPLEFLEGSRFRDVPLEMIAEELLRKTSLTLKELMGWMAEAIPNRNHRLLASFADRGLASVITTNFDELIEHELSTATTIEKLHGTISDLDNLVMRLSQIGRGLVSRELVSRVTNALSDKSVCFIGYAARDPDIFPVLCKLRLRKILWIARPCKSTKDLESAARELEHCERLKRSASEFECISVDANELFDSLSRTLRVDPPARSLQSRDWRQVLHSSTSSISRDEAAIAFVRILAASGEWRKAAAAYTWLRQNGDVQRSRLEATLYEAEAWYRLNHYKNSETSARRAQSSYRKAGIQSGQARALQILGLIKGRDTRAAARCWAPRYLERVRSLLQGKADTDSMLLLINNDLNLGVWLKNRGRLGDAQKVLNRGLKLGIKVGDFYAQQRLHTALGIVYRRRRQMVLMPPRFNHCRSSASSLRKTAIRHFRVARELAVYLGNTAEEVRTLINLVNLEMDGIPSVAGALRRVLPLLDECEELVQESPESEQRARVKELRGKVLVIQNRAQEAVSMTSDALTGLWTNADRASCLKVRAEAYEQLGLSALALKDLQAALSFVSEGPDKNEVRAVMTRIYNRQTLNTNA